MNRYGRNYNRLDKILRSPENVQETPNLNSFQPVFVENLEAAVILNENYRTVKYSDPNMLLAVMSVMQDKSISGEIHPNSNQFVYIVRGRALVSVGKSENEIETKTQLSEGYCIIIPQGMWHEIRNVGDRELKLFSVYAPPVEE